ncbi:tripartite tricarboxylate transporter substrate binding protein [Variovorax terrae]|uniref:Tripartite tricarboxylate transporter substrate binding protein n=1 Tax=Variovorax terrae TaxID=2923278 RepID=A0A9X1VTF4_9BURK|nr:tripartite tricarboxylate transporter substrate binding protein [Variovorax terrae]MCJ0762789.1 tripartite tricarboxylate transporter substrate binding protein [Variovorax terrae]
MKHILLWAAAALLAFAPVGGHADTFPSRPIRLIVPWPAGGSTDVSLRVLANAAARHLGQPVIVENRPGAAGTLGVTALLQAKPDGYTLSQLPMGIFRVPHMQKVAWDPVRDLSYVIGVSGYTYGLVVRSDAPWKTLKDYLDDARKRPDAITYGTAGVGGTPHLNTEQLAAAAGVRLRHVPYRGTADNLQAVLGGHVMSASEATGWGPHVDKGDLRLLATWGAERTSRWPNAPTLKELGYNLVSSAPYGIGGPKGMDPNVTRVLHDAFRKAMQEPEHLQVLARYDQPLLYLGSEDYARFAQEAFASEKALVERLGLRSAD